MNHYIYATPLFTKTPEIDVNIPLPYFAFNVKKCVGYTYFKNFEKRQIFYKT